MAVVVASIPAGHVYVRHLDAPGGSDAVVRLPDRPVTGGSPDARWWPPAMLDAGWVRAHADEFDIMHVHFGFDFDADGDGDCDFDFDFENDMIRH